MIFAREPRAGAPALRPLRRRDVALAAEARLAALRDDPAVAPARIVALSRSRGRRASGHTLLASAALLLAAACAVAASYVLKERGEAPPQAPAAFSASADGSGRIDLPASADGGTVRVSVEPAVRSTAGWFWCVDTTPALPAEQRRCRGAQPGDPDTGWVIVEEAVPSGRDGAFVQTYCDGGCTWWVELFESSVARRR